MLVIICFSVTRSPPSLRSSFPAKSLQKAGFCVNVGVSRFHLLRKKTCPPSPSPERRETGLGCVRIVQLIPHISLQGRQWLPFPTPLSSPPTSFSSRAPFFPKGNRRAPPSRTSGAELRVPGPCRFFFSSSCCCGAEAARPPASAAPLTRRSRWARAPPQRRGRARAGHESCSGFSPLPPPALLPVGPAPYLIAPPSPSGG